jgi:hypothetical protein
MASAPPEFYCPVLGTPMFDPVSIETGENFERRAIEDHFKFCNTNPITKQELKSLVLIPNKDLRQRISAWLDENQTQVNKSFLEACTKYEPKDMIHYLDAGANPEQELRVTIPRVGPCKATPLHLAIVNKNVELVEVN